MPYPFRSFRSSLLASTCVALLVVAAATLGGSSCKKKSPVSPTPAPEVLVNTNNPPGSSINWDARTSIRTPANSGSMVFDDFVSRDGVVIARVGWQGIYCAEVLNAPAAAPTATGFVVAFYDDANNSPNATAPLQSVVYPLARVAETFDQAPNGNCGATQPTAMAMYRYVVTLDTPFNAAAGVRYWLGIQAQVSYVQANNPNFIFWGWRNGLANNNRSIQINASGNKTEYATDRAFSIEK